eukprot:1357215-Pleurochrysis_carterae.AAC.1
MEQRANEHFGRGEEGWEGEALASPKQLSARRVRLHQDAERRERRDVGTAASARMRTDTAACALWLRSRLGWRAGALASAGRRPWQRRRRARAVDRTTRTAEARESPRARAERAICSRTPAANR